MQKKTETLYMIDFRKNSFTLFRYIAATQVLLNHADHLDVIIPEWIGIPFRLFQGVPLFFGLSGFLIWKSLDREEGFLNYLKNRFIRLYPELWMSVLLSVFSIIILYWKHISWPVLGLFAVGQGSILQFWTPSFLDGFGVGTPNGSLWTIPIFVQFYLIIYFLHKWIKHKTFTVWLLIFMVAVIFNVSYPYVGEYIPSIVYRLYGMTIFPYFYLFLTGCIISEFYDVMIPFLKKYWWIFFLIDGVCLIGKIDLPGRFGLVRTCCLILAVIGMAYFIIFIIKMDLSYEIYLLHMVVINSFIQIGVTGNYFYFILAIIVSIILSLGMNILNKRIIHKFGK